MNVVLVGQGGHSKVVEDIVAEQNMKVVGYLDDKYPFFDVENDKYVGPIQSASQLIELFSDIRFIISIGDNHTRNIVVERLNLPLEYYQTLAHPTAVISRSAEIGAGSVIMAHAVVQPGARIGQHVIVNTGAIVEHDNNINHFVHLSPNVTLTGSVSIEEGTHIGAGATIIPNIRVGAWSVVGAGATVIDDLPPRCMAVGVPAKIKVKEDDRLVQ